jgi:DNA-binding transcriptional MerR regulator
MAEPVEPLTPELEEIPDKLYFRIGEVSRLTGVKQYVLRFWESEFPGLGPKKSGTGHRLYRRKDVEMVLEIKRLLYDKRYTIEGARKTLENKPKPLAVAKPARRGRPAKGASEDILPPPQVPALPGLSHQPSQQADLFADFLPPAPASQAGPPPVDLSPIRRELRAILDLLR